MGGIETVSVVYNLKAIEVVYRWGVLEYFGLKLKAEICSFFVDKRLCVSNKNE